MRRPRLPRLSARQLRDGALVLVMGTVGTIGAYRLAVDLGYGRSAAMALAAANALWVALQLGVLPPAFLRATRLWFFRGWPVAAAVALPPVAVAAAGVAMLAGHSPGRTAAITAGYGAFLAVGTANGVRLLRAKIRATDPMVQWLRWSSEPAGRISRRIDVIAAGLRATPPEAPERVRLLRHLGYAHKARYAWNGKPADITRSVAAFGEALRAPAAGADAGVLRLELGTALFVRFRDHGNPDDLGQSLQFGERALTSLNCGQDLARIIGLVHLANVYQARHGQTGRLTDLERAVALAEQALAAAPPRGARALIVDVLAMLLLDRYDRGDRPEDLERAIELCRSALAKLRAPTPLRVGLCGTLAGALERRYQRTGAAADLAEAERLSREAARVPVDRADAVLARGNRALVLAARYARTGDSGDLRRAVEDLRRSVAELPEGAPFRRTVQGNLAALLGALGTRTGELDIIDEAVALQQRALTGLPGDSAGLGPARCGLAALLFTRYQLSADLADLVQAIARAEEAFAAPMLGRRERRYTHGILGACYARRAATRLARPGDLDRGFAHVRAAYEATPEGTPEQVIRLDHLAAVELSRSADPGGKGRIEEAIRLLERSIEAEPADSPSRLSGLTNLGDVLAIRWDHTGRPEDLEAAVERYRAACAGARNASAWTVLQAATRWAELEAGRGAFGQAADAYGIALRAMRNLFEVQPLREHREAALQATSGLPAHAAYALAVAGRPAEAVTVLEDGRALLLTEALAQDQADLATLVELGHGGLAERFRQQRNRVRELEQPDRRPLLPGSPPLIVSGADMRAARAELARTVDDIRAIPRFERFLRPATFGDVSAAARAAPIVYLAGTVDGGFALLVGAEGPASGVRTVWLPQLTAQAVEERFSALQKAHERKVRDRSGWRATLDEVTAWLWTAAMGPVLAALGQAPAAVLIPTGLLGLLPLHAAWTMGQEGRCYAIDRLTLTYAPNARALTAVRSIAGQLSGDNLLAVADPDQDVDARLPFAGPEAEAARCRFDTALVLRQRSATAGQVVRCLPRYRVHHFACHATTNLVSPLDSALILANGDRLSLRTLLGLRPDGNRGLGARLAVLSACQTHLPGRVLPDEVIGLPTGLLQAGVAGVIASYWAVSDDATALLMTRFYHHWKIEGRTPAEALARAQCWLRDSSNGDKLAWLGAAADAGQLSREVSATLGRAVNDGDPGALDFRHPAFWAAFAYTGA